MAPIDDMPEEVMIKVLRCLIAPVNAADTETSNILKVSRAQLLLTINKYWYKLSKTAWKQEFNLARKSIYKNLAIAIEDHVNATKQWEEVKFFKITPEAFANVIKTRDRMEELSDRYNKLEKLGKEYPDDI